MANKTQQLSYKDVLHTRERIGHITKIHEIAKKLGYPYFLWNERVYALSEDSWDDTELTVSDVV